MHRYWRFAVGSLSLEVLSIGYFAWKRQRSQYEWYIFRHSIMSHVVCAVARFINRIILVFIIRFRNVISLLNGQLIHSHTRIYFDRVQRQWSVSYKARAVQRQMIQFGLLRTAPATWILHCYSYEWMSASAVYRCIEASIRWKSRDNKFRYWVCQLLRSGCQMQQRWVPISSNPAGRKLCAGHLDCSMPNDVDLCRHRFHCRFHVDHRTSAIVNISTGQKFILLLFIAVTSRPCWKYPSIVDKNSNLLRIIAIYLLNSIRYVSDAPFDIDRTMLYCVLWALHICAISIKGFVEVNAFMDKHEQNEKKKKKPKQEQLFFEQIYQSIPFFFVVEKKLFWIGKKLNRM